MQKKSSRWERYGALLVLLLFLTPAVGMRLWRQLGYVLTPINVSGTGSMYPTFPKGEGKDPKALSKQIVGTPGMLPYPNGIALWSKRYFGHTLDHGDIVVIENDKILAKTKETYGEESGLVKRLVGLPGDTIQLRDGILYRNSIPQKEPYVATAQSTYGGKILPDCTTVRIPAHKYIVMGDNRKGSSDSRHDIGFIDEKDIQYVLPYAKQKGVVDRLWHDPSNDLTPGAKTHLDVAQFFSFINEKRAEKTLKKLKYEPKLAASAAKRGSVILENNDFSFEATKSGYTMTRAMNDAGYSNIVYGEWFIQGSYETDELIDALTEFPEGKKFFEGADYQDIGIAEVTGSLNDCPTPMVIVHAAGYVPPNYKKDVVDSWRAALSRLREIQPSWEKLKTVPSFYDAHRGDVDRMNAIIAERINGISGIVSTMDANRWLTDEQESFIDKDESLGREQEELAKKINGY